MRLHSEFQAKTDSKQTNKQNHRQAKLAVLYTIDTGHHRPPLAQEKVTKTLKSQSGLCDRRV